MQLSKFYPILPSSEWVSRLVPLGIKTVQIRIKEQPEDEIARQISEAIDVCGVHDCQLIINDYWDIALKAGASHIHIGQEDLAALTAEDLEQIREAGISLGISTHSTMELYTAIAFEPGYIALGPIWETTLKKMKWQPQGLDKIQAWKTMCSKPLVAIGGITLERAPSVFERGADSIAVVSDIIMNDNPEQRVSQWLELGQTA